MKTFKHGLLAAGFAAMTAVVSPSAHAQYEPFIGQLMLVGFTYCPRTWTEAAGQLLPITGNEALFSLYGTTFGGDGRTTFALPDLRGRAPISFGQGPGLQQNYQMGQFGGTESLTVGIANMPPHSHDVNVSVQDADKNGPSTDFLAKNTNVAIYNDGPPDAVMDPRMIGSTGNGQPIQKRSPYLTMRWCVALQGIYPPRS